MGWLVIDLDTIESAIHLDKVLALNAINIHDFWTRCSSILQLYLSRAHAHRANVTPVS